MKKSLLFFVLLTTVMLTVSATVPEDLLGKWYIESLEMGGVIEEFESESDSPWMEFKEENVLLLGEPNRDPEESEWLYDEDSESLFIESFGVEVPFSILELTETKLKLQAERPDGEIMTMILFRNL